MLTFSSPLSVQHNVLVHNMGLDLGFEQLKCLQGQSRSLILKLFDRVHDFLLVFHFYYRYTSIL